jgi:parvulin-like peptidyl-prolyl isomerase
MRFKNLEELTVDDKKDMLKTLLVNELLVNISRENGLFEDPAMIEQGDQYTLTQARAKIDEFREAKDFEPTDSMMQAYFNEHINDFVVDKPLHVYHIIFTDSMQAEVIYDSISNGADFVEMAKRYYPGEPEIREVAYDLDFISEREMPKAFWDTANSLQVGTISKPVKTEWGWHIIKLVSRKRSKTFDQVKSRIKSMLRKEANEKAEEEYVARLRKRAKIEINEPLLAEYRITSDEDSLKKHSASNR